MDEEITPAMIEAGVRELLAFDRRYDDPEDALRAILGATAAVTRCTAAYKPGDTPPAAYRGLRSSET
jgi:hypothetical protein